MRLEQSLSTSRASTPIRAMVKAMAWMESHYRISDEEFDEAWQLV